MRSAARAGVTGWTAAVLSLTCLLAPGLGRAVAPKFEWLPKDPASHGQVLKLKGMTFVASEGSENEIVLRAAEADFYPEHEVADLLQVEVEVAPGGGRVGFDMQCDKGRLHLGSQDFVAEGHVVGTIEGGRRFEAAWVAYDPARGLLYTDEPVLVREDDGSVRGGGFRYFVNEQRFRLIGGTSIVQEP